MKKPTQLDELLEDLKNNPPSALIAANALFTKDAYAVVYISSEAYSDEDGIRLSHDDCEYLFSTPETVDMLMDALANPEDASIIVHALEFSAPVLDTIERRFASIDEA